jgi:hypothetical protein
VEVAETMARKTARRIRDLPIQTASAPTEIRLAVERWPPRLPPVSHGRPTNARIQTERPPRRDRYPRRARVSVAWIPAIGFMTRKARPPPDTGVIQMSPKQSPATEPCFPK